jgi:hypothetical protein
MFSPSECADSPETWRPLRSCVLHDVQALFGGCILWASQSAAFVRVIAPSGIQGRACFVEKRYGTRMTPPQWAEAERLAAVNRFFTLSVPLRPGLPDEGLPRITLTAESGETVTVECWASQRHPEFDPLYQYLRAFCRSVEGDLLYEGEYDPAWTPGGNEPHGSQPLR